MEDPVRKPYPSDLTDGPWELVRIVLPEAKPGGRPSDSLWLRSLQEEKAG